MSARTLKGTRLKKIKISGFRKRMATKSGRRVINARRKKGRVKLTV
jgi:large subunit ribosomal protein L34